MPNKNRPHAGVGSWRVWIIIAQTCGVLNIFSINWKKSVKYQHTAHVSSCHVLSVRALILSCTEADAVLFKRFLCWWVWAAYCRDNLQMNFFGLCLVRSEMLSTLSCGNNRSLPGLDALPTDQVSLNSSIIRVAMWCLRFGKHFHRLLFDPFCVFTSTMIDVFHHRHSGLKKHNTLFNTLTRFPTACRPRHNCWSHIVT